MVLRFELKLKLKFELKPLVLRFALRFIGFVLTLMFDGGSFWNSQNRPAPKLKTTNVPRIVNAMVLTVFGGGSGGW